MSRYEQLARALRSYEMGVLTESEAYHIICSIWAGE